MADFIHVHDAALRTYVEAIFAAAGSRPREAERVADPSVLLPGDPERARRAERQAAGIPVDRVTWSEDVSAGSSVGAPPPPVPVA